MTNAYGCYDANNETKSGKILRIFHYQHSEENRGNLRQEDRLILSDSSTEANGSGDAAPCFSTDTAGESASGLAPETTSCARRMEKPNDQLGDATLPRLRQYARRTPAPVTTGEIHPGSSTSTHGPHVHHPGDSDRNRSNAIDAGDLATGPGSRPTAAPAATGSAPGSVPGFSAPGSTLGSAPGSSAAAGSAPDSVRTTTRLQIGKFERMNYKSLARHGNSVVRYGLLTASGEPDDLDEALKK